MIIAAAMWRFRPLIFFSASQPRLVAGTVSAAVGVLLAGIFHAQVGAIGKKPAPAAR